MTTQTPTLTDFLLARIAEDEARVRTEGIHPGGPDGIGSVLPDWEERRWVAECEAKRRIVEREVNAANRMTYRRRFVLLDLATIYADHPDYREEWKP